MSIYPEVRGGKRTGRWHVEVQRNKQRLHDRVDSHKEAKTKEREFIQQLEDGSAPGGKFAPSSSLRLSDAISEAETVLWVGKGEAENNFKKLRFMETVFGDKHIDAIETKDVDALVKRLRRKGPKGRPLEDSTINRYLAVLSRFLKWSADRNYRRTPLPKIEWMDEDEGRIRWIEDSEQVRLLQLLPDPFDAVVRVAIQTGMRKSEIYEAVSGDNAKVTADHVHLWKTKNRTARSIPINAAIHADLMHLRQVGMPTERQLRYEWDKAKDAMKITDEDFVFHCCRHTFCTRLVQANVNIRIIKELAGHKTIQTTMRYTHVSDLDLRKAMDSLLARDCSRINSSDMVGEVVGFGGSIEGAATNKARLSV